MKTIKKLIIASASCCSTFSLSRLLMIKRVGSYFCYCFILNIASKRKLFLIIKMLFRLLPFLRKPAKAIYYHLMNESRMRLSVVPVKDEILFPNLREKKVIELQNDYWDLYWK